MCISNLITASASISRLLSSPSHCSTPSLILFLFQTFSQHRLTCFCLQVTELTVSPLLNTLFWSFFFSPAWPFNVPSWHFLLLFACFFDTRVHLIPKSLTCSFKYRFILYCAYASPKRLLTSYQHMCYIHLKIQSHTTTLHPQIHSLSFVTKVLPFCPTCNTSVEAHFHSLRKSFPFLPVDL